MICNSKKKHVKKESEKMKAKERKSKYEVKEREETAGIDMSFFSAVIQRVQVERERDLRGERDRK